MNPGVRRDLQRCRRWTPRGGPIEGPLPVGTRCGPRCRQRAERSSDPRSPEHYRRPISGTKGPMAVWSDEPQKWIRTVVPLPAEDGFGSHDRTRPAACRVRRRVKASASTQTPSLPLLEGVTFAHLKEGASDHHFRASQTPEGHGADFAPVFKLRGESLGPVQSLDVVCPVLHSDDSGQLQALHRLSELQAARSGFESPGRESVCTRRRHQGGGPERNDRCSDSSLDP